MVIPPTYSPLRKAKGFNPEAPRQNVISNYDQASEMLKLIDQHVIRGGQTIRIEYQPFGGDFDTTHVIQFFYAGGNVIERVSNWGRTPEYLDEDTGTVETGHPMYILDEMLDAHEWGLAFGPKEDKWYDECLDKAGSLCLQFLKLYYRERVPKYIKSH